MKRESHPEAVFVFVKRNYKLYANIGLTLPSTKRFFVVLDTGADPSFTIIDDIPQAMREEHPPLKDQPSIRTTSDKTVPIVGTIDLTV